MELSEIHQAFYFFINRSQLSTVSLFTQETIEEFINYYYVDDCNFEDIFLFKNVFLNNVLNEEIIIKVIETVENSKQIRLVVKNRDIIVAPVKSIFDREYGRQYVIVLF